MSENNKKSFWHGFGIGILFYIGIIILSTLEGLVLDFLINNGNMRFEITFLITAVVGVVGAILYLPLSIITGVISTKKGYKKAIKFMIISTVIIFLAIGCCNGLIFGF